MAAKRTTESKPMQAIRKLALAFPDVEESDSCVNRAFSAKKKNFLFLGMKDDTYNLRLKLKGSIPEAESLAKEAPENYSVGLHGWTLITLPHAKNPPRGLMKRWIDESFRLIAPKATVAKLKK